VCTHVGNANQKGKRVQWITVCGLILFKFLSALTLLEYISFLIFWEAKMDLYINQGKKVTEGYFQITEQFYSKMQAKQ